MENGSKIEVEIRASFFDDCLLIVGAFWNHFGSQNGTKMGLKIDQKNDGFLDRSWKGSGAATERIPIKNWPVQGPRGGVGEGLKPLPRGKRGSGKKDAGEGMPLNHLSPRGLVGFCKLGFARLVL